MYAQHKLYTMKNNIGFFIFYAYAYEYMEFQCLNCYFIIMLIYDLVK